MLLSLILDLRLLKKSVLETPSLLDLAVLLLLPAWVADHPSSSWHLATCHPLLDSRIHFSFLHLLWV